MSHQTGIQPNANLQKVFKDCESGKIFAFKISINTENEELICSGKVINESSRENLCKIIHNKFIEECVPCYVLLNLDSETLQDGWLLLTWIPETANVRNKMLYASTKATLKRAFGLNKIKDEVHATIFSETDLKQYFGSKTQNVSNLEKNDNIEKLDHSSVSFPIAGAVLGGVDFPITKEAIEVLKNNYGNEYNYVQFVIDIESEIIDISKTGFIKIDFLHKEIPKETPAFHLYLFEHKYNDENIKSNMFIYTMPETVISVKQKMLYSSCKNQFIQRLNQLNIIVDKKLELHEPSEVNEKNFREELYPEKVSYSRPSFAKPKGPNNRGLKRITKTN